MRILRKIFGNKKKPSKDDIQSYLKDRLDHSQQRMVEDAMSDDPFLSDAMEGFNTFGADEFSKTPSFDQFLEVKQPHAKVRGLRGTVNKIAAGLIGFMLVAAVYLYWGETNYERIYAKHFNEFYDPKIYALRSGDDPGEKEVMHPLKEKAIALFLDREFAKSITEWKAYKEAISGDLQSDIYIAYCYLELEDAESAISYLKPLDDQRLDFEYKDETKWYLALAQIKLEDKKAAEKTLKDIIENSDEFYGEKAKSILKQF